MNLSRYFQQALINLNAAKLRSFLAVLGILVGTAAVVALLSAGQLATDAALAQFRALGTDLLAVSLYQKNNVNHASSGFSLSQWRALPHRLPDIKTIAPYSTAYQPVRFDGHMLQASIIGADESLAQVIRIKLVKGHFVSYVDSYEHFCVIGATLAKKIYEHGQPHPLGKQLQVGSSLYTIIGIAKPWAENGFFNEDINQAIIIPIKGMVALDKDNHIHNAVMLLKPNADIDNLITHIKHIITQQVQDLTVFARSAKQIIANMESQGRIFTLLLAIIGSVSLFVGGIGVMNVMLVSVSERKKEIGIRKAVGAKNKDIQSLFLAESMMLSFLGGSLGVMLGLLFTFFVAYFSDWPYHIYYFPPLVGFSVSVIIGIFFGFYPARRAAKLEPIASLRNE